MTGWIIRFAVRQWRTIDHEYRTEALPSGPAAAVLISAAISLSLGRFVGSRKFAGHISALAPLLNLPDFELFTWLYWAAFKLVTYGLIPVLCIKLVLRQNIVDHGLRFVKEPKVWLLYLGLLFAVLPIAYLASTTQTFLSTYPKYRAAGDSWSQFLIWESAYAFQFLMLEFFFRGFLIFALARYVGSLAIFVMIVPYAMIHFDKPLAECLGSIVAGVILGTIALRTRSIYGGVLVHCAVAWSMDLFALSHTGSLARLLR